MRRLPDLLAGPVGPTLVRLALPMAAGLVAVMVFNVVDTFWVGRLGAAPLAAMGFTFPVTLVLKAVTLGLGIGATAVIARAIGAGEAGRARRLTTHALILGGVVVAAISAAGLAAMDPLFSAMGATAPLRALIRSYMVPWFLGIPLLVLPMVGNAAIRATGDTRTPAAIMVLAGGMNAALDPFLIFGWGPFPALGLAGAALSSVASWAVAFVAAGWVLAARLRLLALEVPRPRELLASWRAVLAIGLPAAATNLLVPLASGILTRLVAAHGAAAVAGFGVATRVEPLAMIGIMAMASALTPFVAQNLGAGNGDRIRAALGFAGRFALAWGAASAAALGGGARAILRAFSAEPAVVGRGALYLRVVPSSHFAFAVAALAGAVFNALGRPLLAAALVALRVLALAVPLAWAGDRLLGLPGLFAGVAAANLLAGVVAWSVARRVMGGV